MKRLLLLGLLAMACGGESQALFEDEPRGGSSPVASAGTGATVDGGSGGTSSEGGAPETDGGSGPVGGSSAAAGGSSELGGQANGGRGGSSSSSGGGGQGGGTGGSEPVAGGGAATGGMGGGSAGAAGKPPMDPEVPAACLSCVNNPKYFCEVSVIHPNGACIRCSDDGIDSNDTHLDCDGPGPEHYVSKNDHDPGYGCETYVGYMGMCPAK